MSPNCPVCGAFIAHLRDTHSCPGPSGRVSVVDPRDAQIAALTERLRAVEAERDEANTTIGNLQKPLDHIAKLIWGDTQGQPFAILGEAVATQLSALRAELERKDAALRAERQCAENFSEQFAECQWIDMGSYFEVRGPVALMLDSEFAEQAYVARRAALQPKEPPCKTA